MQFSLNILAQIVGTENNFSKTEKKIADFVLANPREVITLSISELAVKCGVSDATVFRFCKHLNLNGYQEFRMELIKVLSGSEPDQEPVEMEILNDDSAERVIDKVLAIHKSALTKSRDALNAAQLEQAVDMITQAKSVYFFGVGGSLLTALEAKVRFMQVSPKFHVDIDPQLQALSASLLPAESLAVIFSYSGATNDIIEIAKMVKKQGCPIIVITRFLQSPLTALADVVLISGVNEVPYQAGSLTVKVGILFLLDVLYTEYCKKNIDESNKNKMITSRAVIDKIPN